jgi:hypothetical protein
MKIKAGDKLRVVINDGTLKELIGTVFEGEKVFKEGKYRKTIQKGLFFRMEKFVWDENGNVMNRYACHYAGKIFAYDKETDCNYTELDGILRIAKKVEKMEVQNETTQPTN